MRRHLDKFPSKRTSRGPEPLPCVDGDEADVLWWYYEGLDREEPDEENGR